MKVPVPMIGGGGGGASTAVVIAILLGIAVFAARKPKPPVAQASGSAR